MTERDRAGPGEDSPMQAVATEGGPDSPQAPAASGNEDLQQDRLPSWGKMFSYFLLLGFINIGGPVAQIAMMFNHMVERQGWLTKERFTRIMAFCHMLPGPEALQLAIYVGHLKRGVIGGTLAGLTFIIPGAGVMILLSYLYTTYGGLPQVNDAAYILKPAVLGIIAAGIIKLARATVRNVFLGMIVAASALAMLVMRMDFLFVLFLAGAINLGYGELGSMKRDGPKLLVVEPIALVGALAGLWPAAQAIWPQIAWLFLKTGVLSFGGAYASIIFVQHGAVEQFHWLTDGQLLDGVALSVATPGPFMLFTTFVGYQAGGVPGALIATFFVFLPSFVFVIAGARYVESLRSNRFVQAFLAGGSAAVVGVILVVSLRLAPDAIVDATACIIAAVSFLAVVWRRIDIAHVAIASMIAGIAYAIFSHSP